MHPVRQTLPQTWQSDNPVCEMLPRDLPLSNENAVEIIAGRLGYAAFMMV